MTEDEITVGITVMVRYGRSRNSDRIFLQPVDQIGKIVSVKAGWYGLGPYMINIPPAPGEPYGHYEFCTLDDIEPAEEPKQSTGPQLRWEDLIAMKKEKRPRKKKRAKAETA